MALNIKPTHKVITDYYQAIQQLQDMQQLHEGAVAPYFANLLRHCLSQFPHLALIEQYTIKRDKRKPLRADQQFRISKFPNSTITTKHNPQFSRTNPPASPYDTKPCFT